MVGMDRKTGAILSRPDHIRQSIADILGTPIRSRLMVRAYGVNADIIDAPYNDATVARIVAAYMHALARWEPRVTVQSISLSATADGRAVCRVTATDNATGAEVTADSVMAGARR